MSATSDYEFEMFDLRKDVLAAVAEKAREGDLVGAKHEAKRLILRRATKNPSKNANAFETSFEKARDMVTEGGDYDLEIEDMPPILDGHDAEIDPSTEIEGEPIEVITSSEKTGFGEPDTSTYPVVAHPSGFRICTCGAQKYYIICPHTLARVLERNWEGANAVPPA